MSVDFMCKEHTLVLHSEQENKILDYQTQQYKVFPCLASAYALFFVSKMLKNRYLRIYAEIMKGNFKNLPEVCFILLLFFKNQKEINQMNSHSIQNEF